MNGLISLNRMRPVLWSTQCIMDWVEEEMLSPEKDRVKIRTEKIQYMSGPVTRSQSSLGGTIEYWGFEVDCTSTFMMYIFHVEKMVCTLSNYPPLPPPPKLYSLPRYPMLLTHSSKVTPPLKLTCYSVPLNFTYIPSPKVISSSQPTPSYTRATKIVKYENLKVPMIITLCHVFGSGDLQQSQIFWYRL